MLAAYVETANQLARMDALGFFSEYGEASRILRHLNGSPDTTALRLFELHQKHARQVKSAITAAIAKHSESILERSLPTSCLLRLVCDTSGVVASREPGSRDIPESAVPTLPENFILLKGEYWAVRFAGRQERIYRPDVGFAYLQLLLSKPRARFSAAELGCEVAGEGRKVRMGSAGEAIDREALAMYVTRLDEMPTELEEAKSNNDLATVSRLETEREWLELELKRAKGLGGRLRKASDDRNRARNRVCNAIRRALKKVEQFDGPLHRHLKRPVLTLGYNPCYMPAEGVVWETHLPD